MEDLSHISVPKMQATEGFSVLPQSLMDSFSDKAQTDEAARMIGLSTTPEEVPDEGSE